MIVARAMIPHSYSPDMKTTTVTLENLPETVEIALAECRSQLSAAGSSLARDLNAALDALRLIESELKHGSARPKQQRSAAFTRYVVDEGPTMAMDVGLRDFIVRIEAVYKRYSIG